MKKILIGLSICTVILSACSTGGSKSGQDTTASLNQTGNDSQTGTDTMGANSKSTPSYTDNPKGKDMISKLDCIACHKEHEKLVGPAYADVAKKYTATDKNISYLANKVISGGSGVWGAAAMTPHPALSPSEATEMVKYILSIK